MAIPRPARPGLRFGLFVLLVALFASLGGALAYLAPPTEGRELSVDELVALAAERRVEVATFLDEDGQVTGRWRATPLPGPGSEAQPFFALPADPAAAPDGEGTYRVAYAGSDSTNALLVQALAQGGARVEIDPQPIKGAVRLLATVLLPLLILANLFGLLFLLARGGGGGLGEIRSFGTLGERGGTAVEPPAVRFTDVAGADEAVAELAEVVAYLTDPDRYAALGASPPKGVLLFGPPGTGKTLIARATAGEAGVPFFSVAGAEFVESLVGVGAARVRDLFARVRAAAPAILFIDEIDAAGRRRGSGDASGGSDEREQTLNQLLVEIDGFDVASGIVVMGATNRPDILDPALLRPGRFDRHVTIDQPDANGRSRILTLHATGKPLADDVDLEMVARRTPGFTGADLANVVNEAALLAVRDGRAQVRMTDLTEAVQRVLSGPQRRGRLLTEGERRRIATHEAGHAILAAATGHLEAVQRISVVARGRGLGSVQLGSDRDAVLFTRSQLADQLATALSGRAAEELLFGEPSTGSDADLEHATDLARDLVARHGMSERLGRVRLMAPESDLFLGGAAALNRISALTHQQLDAEVRRLVEEAFERATTILEARRPLLTRLVDQLLADETLEGAELGRLLAPATDDPAPLSGPGSGRGPRPSPQGQPAAR
ncbi:ATP-dependent zinc metalloprotease FtsH [Nitriliruptor alkaliphilus]|uniref:ATP-dependent zinc metalloprotease FtsH n=1 Tax=Nitriliruptor alkaliphilus TaxID=427918 RepID=UPI000695E309|nr:ATP-dependent zinc metalloprotease FtsH [Nitriliruptor alkaliphilus]